MTRKKIIIIVLILIAGIAIIGAAGFGTLTLLNSDDTGKSSTKTTAKSELDKGYKAELDGDAKTALKHYEKSSSLCDKSDQKCQMNAEIKVSIMKATVSEQEKLDKQNAAAAAAGKPSSEKP